MEQLKSGREKLDKIKSIVEKEIEKELVSKQNEVTDISEKIKIVLRHLELLKYVVAVSYYEQNASLTQKKSGQEDENEEEKAQTQIHPCVKKLLPFQSNYEKLLGDLFSNHCYQTRNSKKTNISDSLSTNQKEIKSEKIDSCESSNVKVPQYVPPLPKEDDQILSVNSTRGSASKQCYRIIVGNVSKWISPDTREDSSTHKWMVYIRNKDANKDVTKLLKKVRYFLHESYKPHDIIDVTCPPFRLTRRGWGEFPIRVQLHFNHTLDKPVDIIHNLKLDMSCSGIQMLGGETVLEVWLHQINNVCDEKDSSRFKSEPFENEGFKEKKDVFDGTLLVDHGGPAEVNEEKLTLKTELEAESVAVKREPEDVKEDVGFMKFKSEEINQALNNSRKYLLDRRKTIRTIEIEHDYLRKLESTSPNNSSSAFSYSILKRNSIKNINVDKEFRNGVDSNAIQKLEDARRNDVGFLAYVRTRNNESEEQILESLKSSSFKAETEFQSKYSMKALRHSYLANLMSRAHATKINTVEDLVRWFVQRCPIITKLSVDPVYKALHPYSSPSEKEFFTYNIGKQRSAEWFRAKTIQKMLKSLKGISSIEEEIWSTKQIVLWARFHGYAPAYCTQSHKSSDKVTECRSKRSNESSSDSEEDEFYFSEQKFKSVGGKYVNGASVHENRKKGKKSMRKEFSEEGSGCGKIKKEQDLRTWSPGDDPARFGANNLRVLSSSSDNASSSSQLVEVVLLDENPPKESPSKKRDVVVSVRTTPVSELAFARFVCETAKEVGVNILDEEIVDGVKMDSVARVLSRSVSSFVEDLLRRSLAHAWIRNGQRWPECLELSDLTTTVVSHPPFHVFTNEGLGKLDTDKF